jgi:hypothetical protein
MIDMSEGKDLVLKRRKPEYIQKNMVILLLLHPMKSAEFHCVIIALLISPI